MKKLLLITSAKVGDTGKISFAYIFQDKELDAYRKFPDQCSGPFGHLKATDTEGTYYLNLFRGGEGLLLAAPISIENAGGMNKDTAESMPEACSLLCTTEVAEVVKPILEGYGVEVEVIKSEQVLLTA
jgi:hypothetical protein